MEKIYVKIKSGDALIARGYILDISNSGMCLASNKRIGTGKEVQIVTEKRVLPALRGRITSAVSTVRKVYKYRLGIELTSAEKEKRKRVKRFIKNADQRQVVRLKLI